MPFENVANDPADSRQSPKIEPFSPGGRQMMLESSEGARISNIQETVRKKIWPANSTDAYKGKTSSLDAEKERKGNRNWERRRPAPPRWLLL